MISVWIEAALSLLSAAMFVASCAGGSPQYLWLVPAAVCGYWAHRLFKQERR